MFPLPTLALATSNNEITDLAQASLVDPQSVGTGASAKPDKLNLVPGTHVRAERENVLRKLSTHTLPTYRKTDKRFLKVQDRTSRMAQPVKMLVAKPDSLS